MIYLSNLRPSVRNSGDYRTDPHIKDEDLNFWLNQAFSKLWMRIATLGTGQFIKDKKLPLSYNPEIKKYFFTIPEDFFSIEELFLKRGNENFYLERASYLKDQEQQKYQDSDEILLSYTPDSFDLLESAPEGEDSGSGYEFVLPNHWKYFLIDYGIKRARMKQDNEIGDIDIESVSGYSEIISAAQNKNNHFPERPTPFMRETFLTYEGGSYYSYFPRGDKYLLT